MKLARAPAQGGRQRKGEIRLEGAERRDVDDRATALRHHRGQHQPRHADDIEHHEIQGRMPVGVSQLEQLSLRWVPGVVDHRVDATPGGQGLVDHVLEVRRLDHGAAESDAAQAIRQLARRVRRRQQGDAVAAAEELLGACRAHTASGGRDDCDLGICHDVSLPQHPGRNRRIACSTQPLGRLDVA